MIIESWPLSSVLPYEKNPRRNDAAVDAVAESIRRYGFRQPIVVDADGVIVVGHTRLKAAQRLALPTVPVHVARDLTAEQARAYRVADNKLAELADWDHDLLAAELLDLKALDVDIKLLGFSDVELTELFAPPASDGLTDPDDVPAPPETPRTKPGDLWILGEHRLLCGDSSSSSDVDRLIAGQLASMANTDPPYNVRVEPRSNNAIAAGLSSFAPTHHQSLDATRDPSKTKPTTKRMRAKDRPLANDFLPPEEFERMLGQWLGNLSRALVPGGAFYLWGGYANICNGCLDEKVRTPDAELILRHRRQPVAITNATPLAIDPNRDLAVLTCDQPDASG